MNAVRRGRKGTRAIALALVALSTCAVACSQVLGLDSYGSGADAAAGAEGGPDGYAADQTVDVPAIDAPTTDQQATDDGPAADGAMGEDVVVADTGAGADAGDAADSQVGMDAPEDTLSSDDASDAAVDAYDAGFDSGCAAGTVCAPAIPAGWSGPVAVWAGTTSAPPCSAGFNPVFDGGSPSTAPAQCTCTCSSPSGATCGAPTGKFSNKCHQNCGSNAPLSAGVCTNLDAFDTGCPATIGYTFGDSTASGGSCTPSATTTLPSSLWGGYAVACQASSPSSMACGSGGQCTPAAASPFDTRPCVFRQGANTCPGSGYSVQHVYYDAVQEGRACSTCTCGGATGVNCDSMAHVQLWNNTACSNGGSVIVDLNPLPTSCLQPAGVHGATFSTTPVGGTCPPTGGTPTGSVSGQNPVTFCCTP